MLAKATEKIDSSTAKTELPTNFDPDKRFIPKENRSSLQDSKDTFDPDKRYVPKEDGSSLQDRDETFNPDMRVYSDVPSGEKTNILKEESDIDKRVADSENQIQNTDINSSEKEEVRQIKTRNEELEGKKHPETGVEFERKKVEDQNGNEIEGVFAQFDSDFDVQLPEDLEQATDKEQFKECNRQLKEKVDELTSQLKADGYEVLSGPRTTGDGYYESCIVDLENNQIEITV